MVFLHIDKSNHLILIPKLNKAIKQSKNHIFILYYMHGCMPCMQTIPEWKKLNNLLKSTTNDNTIIIVDIDKDCAKGIKNMGNPLNGFPTIRYMTNKGKTIENYEDSNVTTKDRTIDSFMDWIKSKKNIEGYKQTSFKNNRTKKNKRKNKGRSRSRRKY
jgi:hypothetical protein